VGTFGAVLCNLPLDCSGLKREGGTISGKVSLAQTLARKRSPVVLSEGDRVEWELTLNATVDVDGVVGGSYEGTCNGVAVNGKLNGETVARSAMPAHPRAWIELNGLEHLSKGQNYIVLTFKNGQAESGGRIVWRKGNRVGEVSDQDLTWSGNTLTGTVTCKEKARSYPVAIDAQVYGNRFVVGTYMADGSEPLMFRGGITGADTGELAEPTPEQKKQIYALWGKGKK
jgi:hypothetical protein